MNSVTIDYFKDAIESSLCNVYVNRRVAELTGFDVKELDRFIEERSKSFLDATSSKGILEMSKVVKDLTLLSEKRVENMLK